MSTSDNRITTSLRLYGDPWQECRRLLVEKEGGHFFKTAAEMYLFCASIGLFINKQTPEFINDDAQAPIEIPYSVLLNKSIEESINDLYAVMLFNKIVNPDMTDIERLNLFFYEGAPSDRHKLLEPFARTGVMFLLDKLQNYKHSSQPDVISIAIFDEITKLVKDPNLKNSSNE